MARYDRSEAEWRVVEPLLTPRPGRYDPYTTVYNRFNRWAKKGVWLPMFEALAERSPQPVRLIDSSIAWAHQHAAGGKKGVRITPLAVLVAD